MSDDVMSAMFPGPDIEAEGFAIDSTDRAEWALSRIAHAEGEIAKKVAHYEAAVKRAQEWLLSDSKPHQRTIETMTELLRPWANLEVARNGKKKSVKLIGGEVGFRAGPARLEVTDEAAAVEWLKAGHPECIRVTFAIDKRETMQLIEKGGEVPPGVEVVAGEVRFHVKAEPIAVETEKKEVLS